MKKWMGRVLALALCLALAVPAAATGVQHFADVPVDHWAYQQIERAYADGVIAGVSGSPEQGTGEFDPNGTLTMAQFMTIMARAFYGDEIQTEIDKGNNAPWYAPAETVGNKHSLLDGTRAGMNEEVSRYDMAMVMTNILKDKDAVMPTEAEKQATQAKIGDFNSVPANYKDAVTTVFFF